MPGLDDPRFIAVHCVEAALHDAARGFDEWAAGWRPSAALLSPSRSFDQRMADVSQGRPARVDFKRALQRFVRDRLADFAVLDDLGDWLRCRKPLASDLAVHLGVQKIHHWGLGKAFTLTVGVEAFAGRFPEPIVSDGNLFRLLGRNELCWTYMTADALQSCLDEAAGLIRAFLPRLEDACTRRLAALPPALPADIEVRGPLDAAGGLRHARGRATATAADAQLIIVHSATNLELRDRHGFGPGLAVEGRLDLHGAWSYLFVAPASGLDVRVTVPAAGAITTTIGETPSTVTFQPIQDAWVDSVRALALAEAAGGRERRARAGRTVDVIYSLEHDPARYGMGPRCQIHYYMVGGGRGGRMDFFVQIDAATGAVVGTGP